jgi:hypothetical protein
MEFKLAKFLQLINTIFRKVRTETILKIYNTLVLPTFLYGSENWTLDSLTKTKNWSGRNEVIETSGRLHSCSYVGVLRMHPVHTQDDSLVPVCSFQLVSFCDMSYRPQNKWLCMPWTTDWMHTRPDRWIQTELAFTLTKNTTKLNPFEFISVQTTRKENNWKTEETLARAVVTLEMERIKGSNPWCLYI